MVRSEDGTFGTEQRVSTALTMLAKARLTIA